MTPRKRSHTQPSLARPDRLPAQLDLCTTKRPPMPTKGVEYTVLLTAFFAQIGPVCIRNNPAFTFARLRLGLRVTRGNKRSTEVCRSPLWIPGGKPREPASCEFKPLPRERITLQLPGANLWNTQERGKRLTIITTHRRGQGRTKTHTRE